MRIKGFKNLLKILRADGIKTPLLLADHDYTSALGWAVQTPIDVIFCTPGSNVEANCR